MAHVLWQRGRHGRLVRLHSNSEGRSDCQGSHTSKRRRTRLADSNHASRAHTSASGLPSLPDEELADWNAGRVVQSPQLQDLPDELVAHIFSYLPFDEVFRLAIVCQSWRSASKLPHAFTSVDFVWVDLIPAQDQHELMDLTSGEYEPPPKRSGALAEYLLDRAGSLESLRLGLVSQSNKRNGMASPSQIVNLLSACRGLRRLHLVSSTSTSGLPSNLQQEVLKNVETSCPCVTYLEVSGAVFAEAGK